MTRLIGTPTIKLRAKDPRYAIYAQVAGVIGSILLSFTGLLSFLLSITGNIFLIFPSLVTLLVGLFILSIEVGKYDIRMLKKAINRGVLWLIVGLLGFTPLTDSFGINTLSAIALIISGIFYILYDQ